MRDLDSVARSRMVRRAAVAVVGGVLAAAAAASAQECTSLLPLFQAGRSDEEIAHGTGWNINDVHWCRRDLSRPIEVGPAGVPPARAAGPPPVKAAGPPPVGAAGPPPVGAAGPPPVGRTIKRLP
jgi:hypothetical protein